MDSKCFYHGILMMRNSCGSGSQGLEKFMQWASLCAAMLCKGK